MKKVYKKILVIAAILITGGSIAFGSITISQNLELKKEVTTVTQEKEKAEEELQVCGEEKVQLEKKNMALEGQVEAQKTDIEKLNKEITSLKNEIKKKLVAKQSAPSNWNGSKLTKSKGVNYGPSGKETYYNLPMGGVIKIMRNMGYNETDYPYWVRDDGAKMLGNYIMIAANLQLRPRGTIVDTSLGKGIVCDTGDFAKNNPTQIDIAVNW